MEARRDLPTAGTSPLDLERRRRLADTGASRPAGRGRRRPTRAARRPCQNPYFLRWLNFGRFDHSFADGTDCSAKSAEEQVAGSQNDESVARTRNRAQNSLAFRSARPLGVPAFVMDRRISARLKAAACNNTRLATLSRPRTGNLRSAPVSY